MAQHAGQGNEAIGANRFEGLRERRVAAYIDDDVDSLVIWRETLRCLAPARIRAVIEDVMRAERLEALGFGVCARGRDDRGAGRQRKLDII